MKSDKVRFNVWLEKQDVLKLKKKAKESGLCASSVIRVKILEYLKEESNVTDTGNN